MMLQSEWPAHKISLTTTLKNQAVKQTITLANNRLYTPYRLKLIFDFVYLRITKVSLGKTYAAHKSCLTGYRQNTPFLVKNKVDKSSLKITRKQAVNAAIKGLQAKYGFGNPSTYVNLNQTLRLSNYVKQNIAKPFALATLFYFDKCNSKNSRLNAVTIADIGFKADCRPKAKSALIKVHQGKYFNLNPQSVYVRLARLRLVLASGLGSGYDYRVHPHGESGLVTSNSIAHTPRFNAVFLCVPFGYAASLVWLDGDAFERASFLWSLLTNPVQSNHPHLVMNGSTSIKSIGAHTHA